MAVLADGELTLEIGYEAIDAEWITLAIRLCWAGSPVLDDRILKRPGAGAEHRPGTIHAFAEADADLRHCLGRALATSEAQHWIPPDPDIELTIHAAAAPAAEEFELVLFVDSYNFQGARAYCSSGVSFTLTATRDELARFHRDLCLEHAELCARFDVVPDSWRATKA